MPKIFRGNVEFKTDMAYRATGMESIYKNYRLAQKTLNICRKQNKNYQRGDFKEEQHNSMRTQKAKQGLSLAHTLTTHTQTMFHIVCTT